MAQISSQVAQPTVVHPNLYWDHFFNNVGQLAQGFSHVQSALGQQKYYEAMRRQQWDAIIHQIQTVASTPEDSRARMKAAGIPDYYINQVMSSPAQVQRGMQAGADNAATTSDRIRDSVHNNPRAWLQQSPEQQQQQLPYLPLEDQQLYFNTQPSPVTTLGAGQGNGQGAPQQLYDGGKLSQF